VRVWLAAFAALLLALAMLLLLGIPVDAAEDFTLRDTCKGHWGDFTDDDIATAILDNCTGANQKGDNPIVNQGTLVSDNGDAPTSSRPGADSFYHDAVSWQSCAPVPTLTGDFLINTYVGWWKSDATVATGIRIRKGAGASYAQSWMGWCTSTPQQKFRVFDTDQTTGAAPACAKDEWIFQSGRYDGDTTELIQTLNSVSTNPGSLLYCKYGDEENCNTRAFGLYVGAEPVGFGCSSNAGARYKGNVGEAAYFAHADDPAEMLSEEEICEMCRCGVRGNVPGRGRVEECAEAGNRCETRAYRSRCRRMM
jgi:hypothetical protein